MSARVLTRDADAPISRREAFTAGNLSGTAGWDGSFGALPADWHRALSDADPVYVVWSYRTPIAWVASDGEVTIPDVTYSPTTTQHQHTARHGLGAKLSTALARISLLKGKGRAGAFGSRRGW